MTAWSAVGAGSGSPSSRRSPFPWATTARFSWVTTGLLSVLSVLSVLLHTHDVHTHDAHTHGVTSGTPATVISMRSPGLAANADFGAPVMMMSPGPSGTQLVT